MAPAGVPPVPAPTCVTADVLAECFGGCSGVVSSFSPGPVCGWTWPAIPGGMGWMVFSPGKMSAQSVSGQASSAAKSLAKPIASIKGISGRIVFAEFPVPDFTTYIFALTTPGNVQSLYLSLDNSGAVFFQVGASIGAPAYNGVWTPNQGAHVIFFTVDGAGNPALQIDGVSILLTLGGMFPSLAATYPGGSAVVSFTNSAVVSENAPVTRFMVADSILPSNTDFCCP
jgi:hypothetical protein